MWECKHEEYCSRYFFLPLCCSAAAVAQQVKTNEARRPYTPPFVTAKELQIKEEKRLGKEDYYFDKIEEVIV